MQNLIFSANLKIPYRLDETEKHAIDVRGMKEQIKREAKENNKAVQIKDQIDVEKGISEKSMKSKDERTNEGSVRQQTVWIQYSGYGGGGGGFDPEPLSYDPSSRNYFVKFVFILLLVMLLITVAFVSVVLSTPTIKEVFQDNYLMFLIIFLCIMIPVNYMMMCSECTRRPPCNFIVLIIAVIAMCILVSTVTCRIKTNLILFAVIATAVVVFVCMLLAFSSFDFTKWYLFVVGIAVAFAAVATIISISMLIMNVRFKPLQIGILFIGTIINVVVLIIQLQMILGGRTVEIGESDYALAAFMLYTSIIDLFLRIVMLLNLFDD